MLVAAATHPNAVAAGQLALADERRVWAIEGKWRLLEADVLRVVEGVQGLNAAALGLHTSSREYSLDSGGMLTDGLSGTQGVAPRVDVSVNGNGRTDPLLRFYKSQVNQDGN